MNLDANQVVESQLDDLLGKIAAEFSSDVLTIWGPIQFGTDTAVRRVIEERCKVNQDDSLAVILTTPGGIVEVTQRVVEVIRHHYKVVSFVIPDYAYSAGTILALSGDAIHMSYFSRLGPIDPQIVRNDRLVPALGYCERYDELIEKSKKSPLTDAEISVLIGAFDQAELYEFEQARELSISLLREWLVDYKFKDWKVTETRHLPVTLSMKRTRARAIARNLSNTRRWHSHGSGISADVLRRELKLHIDDLQPGSSREAAVTEYHQLLEDYMMRRQQFGVVHMIGQYLPYHMH